jgi:regulator of nucleoside diphosphate kinase
MNRHDDNWQNVQKPARAAALIYVAIVLRDVAAQTAVVPWVALLGGLAICLFLFISQLSKTIEMKNQLTVTQNDYQRLMAFIVLSSEKNRMPRVADQLVESLGRAKLLTQKDIAKTVITMNSRVKLKDLRSRREVEITITYPPDAEPSERRVSVLSEIGLALLGRKENDIVSWKIPNGVGQFQVDKVIYQPEAAGDYYL